jgi:hypothetical protein
VLAEANRPAIENGPCNQDAFPNVPAGSRWFCFDQADAGEGQGTLEWIPQGVTSAADAGARGEALLVSWYDDAVAPEKGIRVSFLNPATKKYRHVLLAYPYIASGGRPTYEIVGRPRGIHAGGILWYGNYLYVVDTTRGVRVFDMRYIFDLARSPNGDTADKARIGWASGAYRGFGYRYVMPQVDAWVNAAGPDADPQFRCTGTGAPKFSYMAVDRTAQPHRMITGEFCSPTGDVGRVARWPLNAQTGQPVVGPDGLVHASEAYRLPGNQIQGAVSVGDMWYLSRTNRRAAPGELITATPEAGTLRASATRPAGIGPEDLSYSPGDDRLWTLTEFAGMRMLYGVPR